MMMMMYWLLQDLVRQGIPQPFRGIAWQLLCGVDLHCVEKHTYSTYLKKTSAFEKTISRDITRTFPGHDLFKDKDGVGQESLFNVMKVWCFLFCWKSLFRVTLFLHRMLRCEGSHSYWKVLGFFIEYSRTWKVLEIKASDPGKSWKNILEANVVRRAAKEKSDELTVLGQELDSKLLELKNF